MPSCCNAVASAEATARHVLFAMDPLAVQTRGDAPVLVRILVTERQVLEFPLQPPDAEPVGQRRKHLQCFFRHALLPRRRSLLALRNTMIRSASLMIATRTSSIIATSMRRTLST